LFVFFIVVGGCGYHLRESRSAFRDMPGLFIEVVRNETAEVGIEKLFTESIYKEFIKSKSVNIVKKDNSEIILHTTIKNYSVAPIFFNPSGFPIQYRVNVDIHSVLRSKTGDLLWDSELLHDANEYFVPENVLDIKRDEWRAVKHLSDNIAEEIYDMLLESFE